MKNETSLNSYMEEDVVFHGDVSILDNSLHSLIINDFLSGEAVIDALEVARGLRDKNIVVVSCFDSFVEKQSLRFLLKGNQPLVAVVSVGMNDELLQTYRGLIDQGRFLMIELKFDDFQESRESRLVKMHKFVDFISDQRSNLVVAQHRELSV